MTRAVVLLNRDGDAVQADQEIADKVEAALAEAGLDAELELVTGGETEVRCRAIAERGDPLLIVGGGDGTVGAAASALIGTETLLGILPLGTLNHFARDLDIPTNLAEAARLIARAPERRVDVAEMNGRIFINNSAIGLYPLMVLSRDRQQARLGRSKRLALFVASLRTLARFRHQRLALTVNEEEQSRIDTPLLFVGNNDYRIDLGAPGRRDRILSAQSVDTLLAQVWRFDGRNGGTDHGFYCSYGFATQQIPTRVRGCRDDPGTRGATLVGHAGDAYGLRAGLWIDRARGCGVAYFVTGLGEDPPHGDSAFRAQEERAFRRTWALLPC